MSMSSREWFKEYAQKWRDLAGRVQPLLTDRDMVDMFMGTLTGPFFNLLIGSSTSGFTKMVLTGERIESGIKSGKILMVASSIGEKKPFGGKKEINVVYGQKSHSKNNHHQSVGAVLMSNHTLAQYQRGNRHRIKYQERQYTDINMPFSQALQQFLKAELITLKDPPQKPDTSSPKYNPNVKCAYHFDSPGYDTNSCWTLKNKIQNLIDSKEIEFDSPKTPV